MLNCINRNKRGTAGAVNASDTPKQPCTMEVPEMPASKPTTKGVWREWSERYGRLCSRRIVHRPFSDQIIAQLNDALWRDVPEVR